MKKPAILLGTFALAFALGAWYTAWKSDGIDAQPIGENESVATYSCDGGKSIWAAYKKDGSVDLSFSDDSDVTLPHATSASGARYASEDGSLVFWNKGETAFVEEDGEATYSGCVEK